MTHTEADTVFKGGPEGERDVVGNPPHVYHVSGPDLCCQWLPVAESDKTFPELKGAFVRLGYLEALRNTNTCVPSAADRTLHPHASKPRFPCQPSGALGAEAGGAGMLLTAATRDRVCSKLQNPSLVVSGALTCCDPLGVRG